MAKKLASATSLPSNRKTASAGEDAIVSYSMGTCGLMAKNESSATSRAPFASFSLVERLFTKFGMTHEKNSFDAARLDRFHQLALEEEEEQQGG